MNNIISLSFMKSAGCFSATGIIENEINSMKRGM